MCVSVCVFARARVCVCMCVRVRVFFFFELFDSAAKFSYIDRRLIHVLDICSFDKISIRTPGAGVSALLIITLA